MTNEHNNIIDNDKALGQRTRFLKKLLPLFNVFILLAMIWGTVTMLELEPPSMEAVVRTGSSGQVVRDVQQKLKTWGYYNGAVDGIFGTQTRAAVIDFQRKNGLAADGVVGNETFKALGLTQHVTNSGAAAVSGDLLLLARAIHAEAEGEPYVGKVAVGAVLLNRVKNRDFPNSLSGVVYQGLALESVSNGRFNTNAGQESIRAARDAMNGWDPTYGCLYFWNPAKAVNPWIWTRTIVVRYGNHVFGK